MRSFLITLSLAGRTSTILILLYNNGLISPHYTQYVTLYQQGERLECSGFVITLQSTSDMFTGSLVAVVTPMKSGVGPQTEVDPEGLERVIEYHIENKSDGIVAVGTTGESRHPDDGRAL